MVELMEEVEGEEVEILFQALLQFLYSELNSMYKLEAHVSNINYMRSK